MLTFSYCQINCLDQQDYFFIFSCSSTIFFFFLSSIKISSSDHQSCYFTTYWRGTIVDYCCSKFQCIHKIKYNFLHFLNTWKTISSQSWTDKHIHAWHTCRGSHSEGKYASTNLLCCSFSNVNSSMVYISVMLQCLQCYNIKDIVKIWMNKIIYCWYCWFVVMPPI